MTTGSIDRAPPPPRPDRAAPEDLGCLPWTRGKLLLLTACGAAGVALLLVLARLAGH